MVFARWEYRRKWVKMKDVIFSFFDVKIVPKGHSFDEDSSVICHAIFSFYCRNAKEAKRKALQIPTDSENWKVEGCWKV